MIKNFVYYQPNKLDKKDRTGDCQIRALSKVLNLSWLDTFDLIIPLCRKYQISEVFSGDHLVTKKALKELGFRYCAVPRKTTVSEFARMHKRGSYIVRVYNHAVAVVGGRYYDTWDSGDCKLYGYYKKIEE